MIPKGFCQCGCGQRTSIAKRRNRDVAKGDPYKYMAGHGTKGKFSKNVKRGNEQARNMYQLKDRCEGCQAKHAIDRHHKDGNPSNNKPENIAYLCRRCHMQADGRLEQFRQATGAQGRGSDPSVKRDWHGRFV